MKTLLMVNGTMGVGKTSVCRALQRLLQPCVFLDGDWCWDMTPFTVTEETKAMVLDNISYLLNRYLACTAFDTVLFCWVMQERAIVEAVLSRLEQPCTVRLFTLTCSEEALRERLQKDIEAGRREPGIVERSLSRLPLYAKMDSAKIDVSACSAQEAAAWIASMVERESGYAGI